VSAGPLPAGTLTFLFTDVEGSTRLLHELGDAYGGLLETHRRLIREAVAAQGGVEFGTGGDALFVAFQSPMGAVAAAAAAQQALALFDWPAGARFRVRMALHTGEASVVDGDYVGVALHVVARLCAAGHGGQVLVSGATYALVSDAAMTPLGSHRVRDVPDAIEIFQLGEGEFPALRTLSALPNNLPMVRDGFVGRELAVVEVAEALSDRRLVTLVGPGGAGKTRLALETAASMVSGFSDGVWFVELAAATSPGQVEALTAQALRIGERGAEALSTTLRNQLTSREVLLVIDNCEHLISAVAPFVGGLLAVCPNVRILATSRELLGVAGEQVIAVTPLGNDDAGRLFVERARAVVPGFDEGTEDPVAIAEICRRLDGLPLAIELAAARLRGVSLRQINDRLDDRFRLLGSGRTRTLEAVVSWSYNLLDPDEQAVFRRLALFPDSFDIEAAEIVAGWENVDAIDVLEIVARLVDTSMLVALRFGDDYRYRMLETLRQYGRDQLQLSGEHGQCVARLHVWARVWSDRLEADMRTPRQDNSLIAAVRDKENLRLVYEQAREMGNHELALRIVTFAPMMGSRERWDASGELLAMEEDIPVLLRAHALTSRSQFAFGMNFTTEGVANARESAALFESIHDHRHAVWARYFELFNAWGVLPDGDVRALAQTVLDDFRQLEEPLGLGSMLWLISQLEEDTNVADALADESETILRANDAPFALAHSLEGRALINLRRDDTTSAARYLAEAVTLLGSHEHGCTAHVLDAVAVLLAQLGEPSEAAFLLGGAEELRRTSGHGERPWEMRGHALAAGLLATGEYDNARQTGRTAGFDALVDRATTLLTMQLTGSGPARSDLELREGAP
jgi:predicted ATPase/class 3 adenylate cyclase